MHPTHAAPMHPTHATSDAVFLKNKRHKGRSTASGSSSPSPPSPLSDATWSEEESSPASDMESEIDESILLVLQMPTGEGAESPSLSAESALSSPETKCETNCEHALPCFAWDQADEVITWTGEEEQEWREGGEGREGGVSSDLALDDADPRELLSAWGL
mmetsp:Transcript_17418/g.34799  ORF Transcript_17418/g.34799 Transcript_17418/m.34799 type:complete len:160 (+) Transcript_17418:802-1281(+)